MLDRLLESKPKRARSPGGTIVSVTAHTALIAAAVCATAQASGAQAGAGHNPASLLSSGEGSRPSRGTKNHHNRNTADYPPGADDPASTGRPPAVDKSDGHVAAFRRFPRRDDGWRNFARSSGESGRLCRSRVECGARRETGVPGSGERCATIPRTAQKFRRRGAGDGNVRGRRQRPRGGHDRTFCAVRQWPVRGCRPQRASPHAIHSGGGRRPKSEAARSNAVRIYAFQVVMDSLILFH